MKKIEIPTKPNVMNNGGSITAIMTTTHSVNISLSQFLRYLGVGPTSVSSDEELDLLVREFIEEHNYTSEAEFYEEFIMENNDEYNIVGIEVGYIPPVNA